MNKELTPLEALCYLDDIAHGRKMKYDTHELKMIIETALKDYEKQKQLVQALQDKIYVKEMKYAKQEKALEIIKSKEMLSVFKDIGGKCFIAFNTTAIEIPEEEYDLLREVLL